MLTSSRAPVQRVPRDFQHQRQRLCIKKGSHSNMIGLSHSGFRLVVWCSVRFRVCGGEKRRSWKGGGLCVSVQVCGFMHVHVCFEHLRVGHSVCLCLGVSLNLVARGAQARG